MLFTMDHLIAGQLPGTARPMRSLLAATAFAMVALSGFSASADPAATKPETVAALTLNDAFRQTSCRAQPHALVGDLGRTARLLLAHEPVKIVALGSSSTAGAGASSPDHSYPSRLAAELRARFPLSPITLINRGVNGEECSDMLARLDRDVLAEKPDLVLWQVGSNALLRNKDFKPVGDGVEIGVRDMRAIGANVLLIDPQYSPGVIANPRRMDMIDMLGSLGKRLGVPVFERYESMRHWHEDQSIPFQTFMTNDGVHLNDWGYACFARLMADDIADAVNRTRAIATASPAGR